MSEGQAVPYETPKVTCYGTIVTLTQAVANAPNTDALCAGNNPIQGVPSGVVCKAIP
jgi:hypothetical protein